MATTNKKIEPGEIREGEMSQAIEEAEAPQDPWEMQRTVFLLPDGFEGTDPLWIAVNGVGRYVLPGQPQTLPEPLAALVDQRNAAVKERQAYYKALREETARNQRYLSE